MNGQKKPPEGPFVNSRGPVVLVGGGALGAADLAETAPFASRYVAADSGAAALLAAGITPEAVIGDFDSLDAATRARLPAKSLLEVSEQETTDFDKALRHIAAPLVVALGFTGARVDHELAVYHVLAARPARRCIVVGAHDIVFHAPPSLSLDLAAGTRVSLFPMNAVTGRSRGLKWPVDGLTFHPAGRIGTSNAATGEGSVDLAFDGPGMLVILPRDVLPAAIAALAPDGWPNSPRL